MNIFKKFGIWSKAMKEIKHANNKQKVVFGKFLWKEIDRVAEKKRHSC